MKRDDLMREINRIDKEINQLITETELPKGHYVPFPTASWIISLLMLAWAKFGGMIPREEAVRVYAQFGDYGYLASGLFAIIAAIRTVQYYFAKSNYTRTSGNYRDNSLKIQELQAQRRDLQIELKSLSS